MPAQPEMLDSHIIAIAMDNADDSPVAKVM